jgi:hypothetical protein
MSQWHQLYYGKPMTAAQMMKRHRAIARQVKIRAVIERHRAFVHEHRASFWLLALAGVLVLAYGSI